MSFVWKASQRLYSPEFWMAMMIRVAKELGMDVRPACVCAGMCVAQESDYWMPGNLADPCYAANPSAYPHDSEGDDGLSTGGYQQQMSSPGVVPPWGWGGLYGDPEGTRKRMDPYESTKLFLSALKRNGYDGSNAQSANDSVQRTQGSGRPDAYAKHWDYANQLYDRVIAGGNVSPVVTVNPVLTPEPGFKGDPWWLAEVLRAEGLSVVEVTGWQNRGTGDQGVLWGTVFHHTGNVNETDDGIAHHPELGLAAHLLIHPNGEVHVCGIGKANHAGKGSWTGIGIDNANPVTIGVEVAILPRENAPHREGWPDVQYEATVKTMAAILRKLGQPSSHCISHREWAQLGPSGWRQGKWDPGAIDMSIFRSDVAAQIHSGAVGDDMFSDDDRNKLQTLFDELTKRYPSRSIYANPGEGLVDTAVGFSLNQDSMLHQELVERLAIVYGDFDAINRVVRVAAERGANPSDTWAVSHAKGVIQKIPQEFMDAWKQRITGD